MFYEVTAVLTADQQNPLASKWALMWENLQISSRCLLAQDGPHVERNKEKEHIWPESHYNVNVTKNRSKAYIKSD